MGSPSGVCNTGMRVEDLGHIWLLFFDELFEFGYLANLLEGKDLIFLVPIDGKAGGVLRRVSELIMITYI